MSDHELRDLRRELAAIERGPGCRYAPDLRRRITDWARRATEDSATASAIASTLGLHPEAIRNWIADDAATSTALVPIEVVAEVAPPARGARALRIVSPAGYRVEGLALDDVAALLRVLG